MRYLVILCLLVGCDRQLEGPPASDRYRLARPKYEIGASLKIPGTSDAGTITYIRQFQMDHGVPINDSRKLMVDGKDFIEYEVTYTRDGERKTTWVLESEL